jgi:hypothetical protein
MRPALNRTYPIKAAKIVLPNRNQMNLLPTLLNMFSPLYPLIVDKYDEITFFMSSYSTKSFYGDLHANGTDGVEFYTRRKMLTVRW